MSDAPSLALVSLNWLGDAVMSMPALQLWRQAHPGVRMAVLTRPSLAGLWALHDAPDEVIPFPSGIQGLRAAAAALRGRFDSAVILPVSFRSALPPALARIPVRRGFPGQFRSFLLTDRPARALPPGIRHQSHEAALLLCPEAASGPLPLPRLTLPPEEIQKARTLLQGGARRWFGLIPGAARGPSKRWPAEHYAEVGRALAREPETAVALLGTPDDATVCEEVRAAIGPTARSLAGKTNMAGFAAVLSLLDGVVANDSGGMHLAGALGVPVVAVFGVTDPGRTGPLGPKCAVLQRSDKRDREIPRDSPLAAEALRRIRPEEVLDAISRLAIHPAMR